ncbi:MAG TPA: hypothetical protein VFS37_15855 [Conexibacter sp.]|nr:hypothetical protein [Conexibacter sp.]
MTRRSAGFLRRNAIALLALFIALGGTSIAAVNALPRNSIGSAQIKRGAIVSSDVKDGGLLARDFKRGQLPAGATGPQGPQGPQGAQGVPGTARAYGELTAGLALNRDRTKNIASLSHPQRGTFCITPAAGIDPDTATILVSSDFANAGTTRTIAQIRSSRIDCPGGTLEVMLWDDGTAHDSQFSFLIP